MTRSSCRRGVLATVSPLIGWSVEGVARGRPVLERAVFKIQIERLAVLAERLDTVVRAASRLAARANKQK